jgi:hypothetical protein
MEKLKSKGIAGGLYYVALNFLSNFASISDA